jgi:DNA-dependent protein kinase catalytic subunit
MCRRYAFGTATQALPVPELMPFRLTQQLAGVLAPHDASAVLRQPMGTAMGALRDGAAILQVCQSEDNMERPPSKH